MSASIPSGAYESRLAWLAARGKAPHVYTYICSLCHHRSHDHTLARPGDLRSGPYSCVYCPCQIAQDGPAVGLSARDAREWDALVSEGVDRG